MDGTKKCHKCKEEVKGDAQKCKHCGADLRNWFIRHKILTAILAIILLGIIASAMGGDSGNTNTNSADQGSSEESADTSATPKEWQKVTELTTNASKQGETFSLQGGQQKLIYKTTGGDYSTCLIYVMDEGKTLDEDGGFPIATVSGSNSDETLLRKKKGNYYLDLKTANGSCSVEVQEYR